MIDEIDRALLFCRQTAGTKEGTGELRKAIFPVLTERLTALTRDNRLIQEIVDQTLDLLLQSVNQNDDVNWKSWIVATALSVASERVGATAWIDAFAAGFPLAGDALQKRAIVFGVILTLDGRCQWVLLKGVNAPIAGLRLRDVHWNCEQDLKNRLTTVL